MATKILKNPSMTETIILPDLLGASVLPNESINLNGFQQSQTSNSQDLLAAIVSGKLVLNDGFADLSPNDAVNLIKGSTQKFTTTPDGKQYVVSSTRPSDYFAYYTGAGDNKTTGKIGEGDKMLFNVSPETEQSITISFIDDVLFDGGTCQFITAEVGSYFTAVVIAPIGVPYPNFNKTGTLDLTATGFVPNASSTGGYDINMTGETIVNRFVNKLSLFGNDKIIISAMEPTRLPSAYKIKLSVYNTSTVNNLTACVTMQMYRKRTIN